MPFVNRKAYFCLPTNLMYFNHGTYLHSDSQAPACCFYEDIQIKMRMVAKVRIGKGKKCDQQRWQATAHHCAIIASVKMLCVIKCGYFDSIV